MKSKPSSDQQEQRKDDEGDSSSPTKVQVYGLFRHPDQPWIEILIGLIFMVFLPLRKLHVKYYQPTKESKDTMAFLTKLRTSIMTFDKGLLKSKGFVAMAKSAGWEEHKIKTKTKIDADTDKGKKSGNATSSSSSPSSSISSSVCEMIYRVPRNNKILQEWNIIPLSSPTVVDDAAALVPHNINVNCYFPPSLLPTNLQSQLQETTNEFGCLVTSGVDDDEETNHDNQIDNKDDNSIVESLFSNIPKDVPIILHFHGGGLVMGHPRKEDIVGFITKTLDDHSVRNGPSEEEDASMEKTNTKGSMKKTDEKDPVLAQRGSRSHHFVLCMIEYSLAPEHPFPTSSIEALSVASHFLGKLLPPTHKVHINGISAGGYLATVATIECSRQYPNRIATCSLFSPMLDPLADSKSYYINGTCAAMLCPTNFLKWCWKAYLQLPAEVDLSNSKIPNIKKETNKDSDQNDVFRMGSNYDAWNGSKWSKSPHWERLIRPLVNLETNPPKCWLSSSNAPKFLIVTNRVDALYEEGKQLAATIKSLSGTKTTTDTTTVVHHIPTKGGHWAGMLMDTDSYKKVLDMFYEMVFAG